MSVLRFDLLTQSSHYTAEPVRGLEVVWLFFLTWVLLKIEKNGIRTDVISGAFNFLFLFFFPRYITVVTVLNMTWRDNLVPRVFSFSSLPVAAMLEKDWAASPVFQEKALCWARIH